MWLMIFSAILVLPQALLQPNQPVERRLQPQATDVWSAPFEAGQYVHVLVEQQGIDVDVTLLDPAGVEVGKASFATGTHGQEEILLVAGSSGMYRIEVHARDAFEPNGSYVIRVDEPRVAGEIDKLEVRGQQAFLEGWKLQAAQSTESLSASLTKYREAAAAFDAAGNWRAQARTLSSMALSMYIIGDIKRQLATSVQALNLWRKVGDRRGEAQALSDIGVGHYRLGENTKALESYRQALQVRQEIGDRSGEALVLNNLGVTLGQIGEYQQAIDALRQSLDIKKAVGDRASPASALANIGLMYRSLGEYQTAIEYYQEALPLLRSANNRTGEATALSNIGSAYQYLGQPKKALDFYDQSAKL